MLTLLYLLWGTSYLAVNGALAAFPPLTLAALRCLGAALLFGMLADWRPPLPRRSCLVAGLLTLGVGSGGVIFAQQWLPSGLTASLYATVGLWGALFSGGRQPWLAILCALSGVVLLGWGPFHGPAIALTLGASAAWAYGSVLTRRWQLPSSAACLCLQSASAAVVLGALALLRQERPGTVSAGPLGCLLYLTVAASVGGFLIYSHLLRHRSFSASVSYVYVTPLIALAVGVLCNGEELPPHAVLSAILIGMGVKGTVRSERAGATPTA